jgi:hypothetical protein
MMHEAFTSNEVTEKTSAKVGFSDLLGCGDSITYPRLVDLRRRGYRNGSWRHLDVAQKALFKCALWIAKTRGRISNAKLMVQVIRVALRLLETARSSIIRAGRVRSTSMFEAYSKPGGVFGWAPRVREWLCEGSYVWYLGVLQVNS